MGGSCGLGHLLSEGYDQHLMIGALLSESYQRNPKRGALLGGKTSKDIEDQIYFRSSDMQRTLLSGSAMLSGLLRNSGLEPMLLSGFKSAIDSAANQQSFISRFRASSGRSLDDGHPNGISVHTMDVGRDHIFPNGNVCSSLGNIRERIFASDSYLELKNRYRDLQEQLQNVTKRTDLHNDDWPDEIFDCILTTVCTAQYQLLPPGLEYRPAASVAASGAASLPASGAASLAAPVAGAAGGPAGLAAGRPAGGPAGRPSLLQETLDAVDELGRFVYTWHDSTFSKTAIAKFLVEFKTELLRAVMSDVGQREDVKGAARILQQLVEPGDLKEFYDAIVESRPRKNGQPFGAVKLALFSGHDTTVLPFLAAVTGLGNNEQWPPYASIVVFETLYDPRDKEYYFRLIHDGAVITNRVPGCADEMLGSDLCRLQVFFHTTKWAAPQSVASMCGEQGPQSSNGAFN